MALSEAFLDTGTTISTAEYILRRRRRALLSAGHVFARENVGRYERDETLARQIFQPQWIAAIPPARFR